MSKCMKKSKWNRLKIKTVTNKNLQRKIGNGPSERRRWKCNASATTQSSSNKNRNQNEMGIEGKDRMKEEGGVLRWPLVSSGHVA